MSARLDRRLQTLRARGEGAFMPFLVIGDPDFEQSLALVDELVAAGADVLEFGFPFSDPPADGPVIQLADQRALKAGINTDRCFEFLAEVQRRHDLPCALLIYFNLILSAPGGVRGFYQRCAELGVDAVLVADVPLEESDELVEAATAAGVAPIFIVGSFTDQARLEAIAARGRGYLYTVARSGITGEQQAVDPELAPTLARLRAGAQGLPLLAGFGISSETHARVVLEHGADGVIVGSAIVRRIAEHLDDPVAMRRAVHSFAHSLKQATRPAARLTESPC